MGYEFYFRLSGKKFGIAGYPGLGTCSCAYHNYFGVVSHQLVNLAFGNGVVAENPATALPLFDDDYRLLTSVDTNPGNQLSVWFVGLGQGWKVPPGEHRY